MSDMIDFFNWPLIQGVLGGGLMSAIIGALMYREHRKRNIREGLFKSLDGYLAVQKNYARALQDKSFSSYMFYFRTLIDLHWSEHQIWLRDALSDVPYKAWLYARYVDYKQPAIKCEPGPQGETLVSYRIVWKKLIEDGYFIGSHPFVEHMNLVHEGLVDQALREKYKHYKINYWGRLTEKRIQ